MNKIASIATMVLLSLSVQSQTLTGCFGLSFGASQDEVKQMMQEKHSDAKIVTDKKNVLGYIDGYWTSRKVYVWVFSFNDDGKMYAASVQLSPTNDAAVFDLYEEVSNDFRTKYGKESGNLEQWTYPYDSNDKYTHGTTAIKIGKGKVSKHWFFENETESTEDEDTIQIRITEGLRVSVRYQDGILLEEQIKIEENKRQGDL